MKRTLFLGFLLFVTLMIYGQAQEGAVEFQKTQHPAAVIELPYPSDIVNAALNDYLSKKGIEKKIQDNKYEQRTQMNEVENQKQKLATWVSQRKS